MLALCIYFCATLYICCFFLHPQRPSWAQVRPKASTAPSAYEWSPHWPNEGFTSNALDTGFVYLTQNAFTSNSAAQLIFRVFFTLVSYEGETHKFPHRALSLNKTISYEYWMHYHCFSWLVTPRKELLYWLKDGFSHKILGIFFHVRRKCKSMRNEI